MQSPMSNSTWHRVIFYEYTYKIHLFENQAKKMKGVKDMIITASAYYQEEVEGIIKGRLRASVHIDSSNECTDKRAKSIARNLYKNMVIAIPEECDGNVAK